MYGHDDDFIYSACLSSNSQNGLDGDLNDDSTVLSLMGNNVTNPLQFAHLPSINFQDKRLRSPFECNSFDINTIYNVIYSKNINAFNNIYGIHNENTNVLAMNCGNPFPSLMENVSNGMKLFRDSSHSSMSFTLDFEDNTTPSNLGLTFDVEDNATSDLISSYINFDGDTDSKVAECEYSLKRKCEVDIQHPRKRHASRREMHKPSIQSSALVDLRSSKCLLKNISKPLPPLQLPNSKNESTPGSSLLELDSTVDGGKKTTIVTSKPKRQKNVQLRVPVYLDVNETHKKYGNYFFNQEYLKKSWEGIKEIDITHFGMEWPNIDDLLKMDMKTDTDVLKMLTSLKERFIIKNWNTALLPHSDPVSDVYQNVRNLSFIECIRIMFLYNLNSCPLKTKQSKHLSKLNVRTLKLPQNFDRIKFYILESIEQFSPSCVMPGRVPRKFTKDIFLNVLMSLFLVHLVAQATNKNWKDLIICPSCVFQPKVQNSRRADGQRSSLIKHYKACPGIQIHLP